ncbi:MAG: transposase [Gammaproteobacteria bacterium]|nr:transposase [Gammaproteobacteria bacterium]
MVHFGKALDKVRAGEVKELKAKGQEPVLTKARWLLLKRPENLSDKQETKLAELLKCNLRSVKAYLLKEEFQLFWTFSSSSWAGWFLDQWCTQTMRSQIEPMKGVAKMLRGHRELLLNWFRAKGQLSSGVVEGFNTKAKLTSRKSFGFRTFRGAEIALYHSLGALPEPELTHRFC